VPDCQKKEGTLKIVKSVAQGLGMAIVVLAILLVGFMFISPRFGWETHQVMSGSMEPALKVGGMIVTKSEKLDNIKVGDIITFQTEGGQKVTHRVIDIVEINGQPNFQTKGDANEEPDPNFVSSKGDEMRKVVFHLPYLGFAAQFMKSKWAFLVLVGIPALILIVMFSRDIWKGILEEKEKRKPKANPDSFAFALPEGHHRDSEGSVVAPPKESPTRIPAWVEKEIEKELMLEMMEKNLSHDSTFCNYSAIRERLAERGIQVALSTIIERAKGLGCYQVHPRNCGSPQGAPLG
jgi:signal peptidase